MTLTATATQAESVQLPTQWSVFGFGSLRDCGGDGDGDGNCDSDSDDAFTCRNSRMRSGASCWPDYAHDMLIYMQCQGPGGVLLWAIDGHARPRPRPAAPTLAAARPTGHPDRYLATGKKVVSTSNRVVINLKCGAPTKIRQGKLVARILTHAQKHDQARRREQ